MGWFSRVITGNEVREYHEDGSYTDRNEKAGTSSTYDKEGNLKEFSIEKNPIFGESHVDSYDSDGNLINSQYKKSD